MESSSMPGPPVRPYTNTCPQNYKFEGKERDTETGNDDFGARYYSNRFGRWLSADWSSVPVPVPYANLTNPQTLNLYAMVADDPESFADIDGHTSFFMSMNAVPPAQCAMTACSFDEYNYGERGTAGGSMAPLGPTEPDILAQIQAQAAQQAQKQQMSLSSQGLEFIKKYEKLRLTPYKDQAGYETIGYGHKVLPGEDFSKGITKDQALELLRNDVRSAVEAVNAGLKVSVKQNQFDALVSFAFNVGSLSVKASNQMMRAVNGGRVTEDNFTTYRWVHVNGEPVVSQGLLRRRKEEYLMYSEGKY
jgi:lysozyme